MGTYMLIKIVCNGRNILFVTHDDMNILKIGGGPTPTEQPFNIRYSLFICTLNATEGISGHEYYTRSYMYPIQGRTFPSWTVLRC